jgi:glycopeptidolipid biosynthesis protein
MTSSLPSTETEIRLAAIFQAALNRDSVGYDDGFIDIGGDSMSAMLCISRIRTAFHVELTVEDFFLDTGSVRTIAGQIDMLRNDRDMDN